MTELVNLKHLYEIIFVKNIESWLIKNDKLLLSKHSIFTFNHKRMANVEG